MKAIQSDIIYKSFERSVYWDIVKGFAILFVIIGHQIQYSCGMNESFADNPVYKFIYGFHMPLFMLVSGYFFYNSTKRHSAITILCNRLRRCVVPIVTLCFIIQLYRQPFRLTALINSIVGPGYWFLWALLVLSCLVMIVRNIPYGIGYIFLFIGMFFLPDVWLFAYISFMFPFFVAGYLFNQYKVFERLLDNHLVLSTILFCILYFALLLLFKKETYIYWSQYSVQNGEGWHQVLIDTQRMVTGFCGSLFIICLVRLTYLQYTDAIISILSYLGQNTLQLYLISLLPLFIKIEVYFSNGSVNYLLAALSTIFVTTVSIATIELIKKNKITNFFFFGEKLFS